MLSKSIEEKVKRNIAESRSRANKEIPNIGLNGQDAFIALAYISAAEDIARRKFDFEWISPRGLRRCDVDVNLGCNLFAESLNQYSQGNSEFIGNDLKKALKYIARLFMK
ncbi:hypothetical protein APA_355 [Pseudanabaena sp. lw0831]|uniref:hypothetical protein n=1 Tax=Pseudanabaena sp. lw0831 TaxID=1357935 RepID=UPI001914EAC5|nr:hypothetical protein [Pseudanabaena sp. lw0831]GBO52686.1 hypothetical protein APA_355 [Pseudanabaena sp. lw0831]